MSVPDVFPDGAALPESALPSSAALSGGTHPTLGKDAGHVRQRAATIDLDACLRDISADAPCGPDLQYDPDYIELARIMQGTPEVEYGGMRIEAADPDWKLVKPLTLKLLARTRDLRLAVWLTRILTGLHGIAGLADGLALIEGIIERHWSHLHPELDEDDDPLERLNTLVALDDMDGLLRQVRRASLIPSSIFGPVRLRDIELATGELTPRQGETAPEPGTIEAAVHAADCAEAEACLGLLERAHGCLERIDALLARRVEPGFALDIEKLPKALRHAARAMRDYLSRHPGREAAPAGPAESPSGGPVAAADADVEAGAPAAGTDGDIHGRDDVVRQLDRICEYYAVQEPGSPVPMLLQRAKRLVNLNFIELMSELSPQGSAEIGFLLGIRPEMPDPGIDPSEAYSTN